MKDNKALKYLTLITGVLTLLLGVYTLVRPMRTFLAIGWILGILLFVNEMCIRDSHYTIVQILVKKNLFSLIRCHAFFLS